MAYLILIVSALGLAALMPMANKARPSFFHRLFERFSRKMAPVSAPTLRQQDGWTFVQSDDPDAFNQWLNEDESGFPSKPGELPSLGSHLLVELFDCDQDSLKLEDVVGKAMREAADRSKATVVAQSFHEFMPFGVSGAVIIQESHYTIHTWPEHGYAAVDLFYCGGTVHVHKAVDVLRERFKPARMKFLVVRRGVRNEVHK